MIKKASRRTAIKSLAIIKSRDIVVDKTLKPCEEGNHSKCTGWAVLKKELSPINANYFLRCACKCHRKKGQQQIIKQPQKMKKKTTKRSTKHNWQKSNKRSKRGSGGKRG